MSWRPMPLQQQHFVCRRGGGLMVVGRYSSGQSKCHVWTRSSNALLRSDGHNLELLSLGPQLR